MRLRGLVTGAGLALAVLWAASCRAPLVPASGGPAPPAPAGAEAAAPEGATSAPSELAAGATEVPPIEFDARPGTLELTIRWPVRRGAPYRVAKLPSSTQALAIDIRQADEPILRQVINRPRDQAISRVVLTLGEAESLLVTVRAHLKVDPEPGAFYTAEGSASVRIESARRATRSISLEPLFVPAIATYSPDHGPVSQLMQIEGANLSLPWSEPTIVTVGGVPASIEAAASDSLIVRAPPSTTGRVAVDVDGIVTTSDTDYRYLAILAAMSPPVAPPGAILHLEGLFGPGTTVNFPGDGAAMPVTAELVGPGRARVAVPEEARSGYLTVTHAGYTTLPLPFRRTSFDLGLQPFRSTPDQWGTARTSETLESPRLGAATAVIGQWIYVIGGQGPGSPLSSVERARTFADGTLGAFQTVSPALISPRDRPQAVVSGPWLYVLGGANFGDVIGQVERARIGEDGSLGPFEPAEGVRLVEPRYWFSTAILGRHVYAIGGRGRSENIASVERAPIAETGEIGPFEIVSGVSLVAPRDGLTATVAGDRILVVGGDDGSESGLATVEVAMVDASGSLGPFRMLEGIRLQTPRFSHHAVVLGDKLYIVGGSAAGQQMATTAEIAPLGGDDGIGPFETDATLLGSPLRFVSAAALIGNFLYELGGFAAGEISNTISRASIRRDGGLSDFALAGTELQTPRTAFCSAVLGDHVYAIGGYNPSGIPMNSVEMADAADTEGNLGPFQTQTPALRKARFGAACAVVGRNLYVIGGQDNDQIFDTIERASIAADGTLGAFELVPATSLVVPRAFARATIAGGSLHVTGGWNGNTAQTTIERAIVAPDGSLGPMSPLPGVSLETGRIAGLQILLGRTLYVLGGFALSSSLSGALSDSEQAILAGDGSMGDFQPAALQLGEPAYQHFGAVAGDALYVLGGRKSDSEVLSQIQRASIGPDGVGALEAQPARVVSARYSASALVLGNYLYVIGGEDELRVFSSVERATLR